MTGPLDEGRHPILRVGQDGTQVYVPKPEHELTSDERRTRREIDALVRWMELLYRERAQRRKTRRPKRG